MSSIKNNIPMLIAGISMLFFGVNLLLRGNIWNVVIGDERCLVSILPLSLGLFLVYMSIRRLLKKDKK